MKRFGTMLLLSLLALPCIAATAPAEFKKYTPEDKKFSVELPGNPVVYRPSEEIADYNVADDGFYTVAVRDFDDNSPVLTLAERAKKMATACNGGFTVMSNNPYPGKDSLKIWIDCPATDTRPTMFTTVMFVNDGHRLYQVMYVRSADAVTRVQRLEHFLDSFHIN